jgi:hypothetical protein
VSSVYDFFAPQPEKNATVFLLKQIMHDWSDEYCIKILTQLRAAATPDTTLLVLDSIMPLACRDPSASDPHGIPGAVPTEAPVPLLANYGAVNEMGYNADFDVRIVSIDSIATNTSLLYSLQMFLLFNSQERTAIHFVELLRTAGWNVHVIHRQPGDSTFIQSIEAKPV